jgi:hypothetical protein
VQAGQIAAQGAAAYASKYVIVVAEDVYPAVGDMTDR